ncbi:Mitochondrial fission 1 protein isoform 1 [Schistosoma japonicum]|uniref:Mitochondrial fission 1 protein n=2 Tax=Schistosoma japonicum TaxID=6182 RepID=Q5DDS7_SCHJA|nr:SJCHGC05667 protein [Schistosoma japonicum]KAH8852213.1 Mitochondrial fission 1 protein [Schistosoma japonicum]TNN06471.1 Mitochondrial fission 1 protein isoform 1 [Schistosoma japonicum]TNN06472.1 Mitochondrial fission 1 protein isoform 1 [Schistosoma japonicum]CAX69905.1 Mitochondrial fission 1 protein [Schistosoma japonicum]
MDLLDKNEPIFSIQESRDSFILMRQNNIIDDGVQFRYAVDLLRTTSKEALRLSIKLLEELFNSTKDDGLQRDCLYYLAIAYTKLSDYENATRCCDNILAIQPSNQQVKELKNAIKSRATKDGLTGLAVVGGAVLGAAALLGIGLGVGLSKRR